MKSVFDPSYQIKKQINVTERKCRFPGKFEDNEPVDVCPTKTLSGISNDLLGFPVDFRLKLHCGKCHQLALLYSGLVHENWQCSRFKPNRLVIPAHLEGSITTATNRLISLPHILAFHYCKFIKKVLTDSSNVTYSLLRGWFCEGEVLHMWHVESNSRHSDSLYVDNSITLIHWNTSLKL